MILIGSLISKAASFALHARDGGLTRAICQMMGENQKPINRAKAQEIQMLKVAEKKEQRKPPVRPHWKGMYKEAEAERARLEAEVAELAGMEKRCKKLENEAEELHDQWDEMEADGFKEKLKLAYEEIEFLRNMVNQLLVTPRDAVKAQN